VKQAWFVALGLVLLSQRSSVIADAPLDGLRPFLKQHCSACHGPDIQENELRFDTLATDLSNHDSLEVWQAILDQLNLGAMPPREEPQPNESEVATVIKTLSAQLRQAYADRKNASDKTVRRRLNRYELRSTLRDLLYLDGNSDYDARLVTKLEDRDGNGHARWNSDDPTREFPADQAEAGLDNIGSRLVMSDFLLEKVIAAAEVSLREATHFAAKPAMEPRRFTSPIRTEGPSPGLQKYCREFNLGYDGIYQRYREPGAATEGLGLATVSA
jgi:hypothetical protein